MKYARLKHIDQSRFFWYWTNCFIVFDVSVERKYDRKIHFLLVVAVLFLFVGCNPSKLAGKTEFNQNISASISDDSQNSNGLDNFEETPSRSEAQTETEALLHSIDTLDVEKRSRSVKQIEKIITTGSEDGKGITSDLLQELTAICDSNSVIYSESEFQKARTISTILADIEFTDALDILIDCSNHSRPVVSRSFDAYVTPEAVVKFKVKALPFLKAKIKKEYDDKYVRCRIATILAEIGGVEAKNILMDAKRFETDEEILGCIERARRYVDQVR